MIDRLLKERNLPELMTMKDGSPVTAENWEKRRLELVEVLGERLYGKMPEYAGKTTWAEGYHEPRQAGGCAWDWQTDISFPTPDGSSYSFPVRMIVPKTASADNPLPAFVFISFGFPKYYPIEELADSGVIIAEMVIYDVMPDDKKDYFQSGMAPHFVKYGQRKGNDPGAITLWAFAASRVLDYLLSLDFVDPAHVGVIGHSRLGKTALWAGANDTRFTHVFSNDSGCCGAAILRKKVGEQLPRIVDKFTHWFCRNAEADAVSIETSEATDYDQHFLLAAMAPRHVCVASATEDEWADPVSEYLCCAAASPAWEINGMRGFIHPDRLPEPDETLEDGEVGYHLRSGMHFLSRHDWQRYVVFIRK